MGCDTKGEVNCIGFPEDQSTLDFRETVFPGVSISFDYKETKEERGLPLTNIPEHQIDYMRQALSIGEASFILCYMASLDKRYFIDGGIVIDYWNRWQENKGRRGYNFIPIEEMTDVRSKNGIILDYLEGLGES